MLGKIPIYRMMTGGTPMTKLKAPPMASLTLAGEKKWVPMTLDGSCT